MQCSHLLGLSKLRSISLVCWCDPTSTGRAGKEINESEGGPRCLGPWYLVGP